jgi:hypothetical protein
MHEDSKKLDVLLLEIKGLREEVKQLKEKKE